MRSLSRTGLGSITAATMAVSTFPLVVFGVLASELIDEFGIARGQVGLLVTAFALVGALSSPFFGGVTDRVGSVTATRGVLLVGAVTLVGVSLAPAYLVLVAAALAAGIPNGWGNPATNALIVDNVAPGTRGVITGVKQSGVQVGIFLGGLLLPLLAGFWGWRWAVASFVLIPVVALVGLVGVRGVRRAPMVQSRSELRVPTPVRWIALYGTLSGVATSAMLAFLPLFAEEDQRWSSQAAGWLIALVGMSGIVARIFWSTFSERRLGHGRTLRLLALLTTVSAGLLALAGGGAVPSWTLVPSALLLGLGAIAWNAVGMLAVMDLSSPEVVGKGTGFVLLGFLLGHSLGPPLMGFSVDLLGTYSPGWIATGALLLASGVVAAKVPTDRSFVTA